MLEMVLCKPDNEENDGDGPPRVTFKPAELACIAGELDLVAWKCNIEILLFTYIENFIPD